MATPARIPYTRPVTRAWITFCVAAAPFLGIIGYSQRGVYLEWRNERIADAVYNEIAALGPEHPWAGHYYAGDGLGFNSSISLAPKAGYIITRFGDGGPWSESVSGGLAETSAGLQARHPPRELLQPLVPVPWGKRRYLIPRDELNDFANAVNHGSEPRTMAQGIFLMRDGDETIPVAGRPSLPAEASSLLRERPLAGKIIGVGADTFRSFAIAPGFVWTTTDTPVLINIGLSQGALPGLALKPEDHGVADVRIVHAGKKVSTGIYRRVSPGDERPQAGWELSTRPKWEHPMGIAIARLPARRLSAKEKRLAALEAERDALPYEKARRRIWDAAAARSFGVSVDAWTHIDDARVEYLSAETRSALERWWGLDHKYIGTVGSGRSYKFPTEPWHDLVMKAAGPELLALKAANPAGEVESQRLMREIEKLL